MLDVISPSDAAPSPIRMQRAHGAVRARFAAFGGSTSPRELYQDGSAKLRLPRRYDTSVEAVLINTAGGLTGGDEFSTSVAAEANTQVTVTTQAHERVYRSAGGNAEIRTDLSVGDGGRLFWLPQETIIFDGARLGRTYSVDVDENASFLAIEGIILGRAAMGETVRQGFLHDRWRVRRSGELVFADDLHLDGDIAALAARDVVLSGNAAFATVVYVGSDADRYLDRLRAIVGDAGGASSFDGKLIARIVAGSGQMLRRVLSEAVALLAVDGVPRVWQQ